MKRHVLDASKLLCPMPLIRVQERMRTLADGELLDVRCTDPGAAKDIPAWCRMWGHEVLSVSREHSAFNVLIRAVHERER